MCSVAAGAEQESLGGGREDILGLICELPKYTLTVWHILLWIEGLCDDFSYSYSWEHRILEVQAAQAT